LAKFFPKRAEPFIEYSRNCSDVHRLKPKLSHPQKYQTRSIDLYLYEHTSTSRQTKSVTHCDFKFCLRNSVLSYKFSFVCGQDLYLIRIYANKFDKHARRCVLLTNLYHILACASKSCKQNARCIGSLTNTSV
jgi:hypothetical protein